MIDAELPIPLHIQIGNVLEKQIYNGTYTDKIPSERDLMDMFSVSRTTVREAVTKLVQDGVLKKIHGKGTFIAEKPPIEEWLSSLNSFTDTVKRMGMKPGSKLLFAGKQKADTLAHFFGEELYTIKRLRYADAKPVAIEKHYYPIQVGLELQTYNLNNATIYDLLENELHITLTEAEQFISTEKVIKADAVHLNIEPSSQVLSAERVIYDQYGEPIEAYLGLYRPDMYRFRIKTRRDSRQRRG
ncbi:GntR family transcriptional regulator [Virgibacillus salexigens]|uniref:HTH-type transcriptional repressor YvoA n=1 Tax=Virgibacillus massiliensis TaxID=1462526 RepID=A0A024Q8H2_9BACI|nr:GntR family transcriptional regulator [Virgibacillus massiliensis]CDQ38804.1 HTH-type transcriptional repressor YvoA [Virgibacillus massiliensis]